MTHGGPGLDHRAVAPPRGHGAATAWLAHLYTASGAVFGLLAAAAIFNGRYQVTFLWLFAATLVDATDGVLARAVSVKERLPWLSGVMLDNVVDYVTYVFVPALFVWHALLVPEGWAIPAGAAMLLSSAYGFARIDAKTADHYFAGFPSYWNVVVFYLYVARWPALVNLTILLVLSVLVFVPVRYVYPSRTAAMRGLTLAIGVAWGVAVLLLIVEGPRVSRALFWSSLAFPFYYFVLSFALSLHRRGVQSV
jgi:phosphatidylcholine synthase